MKEIQAPNHVDFGKPTLFLAGSIEMGVAEKWQDRVIKIMENDEVTILNPRRDDWDSSWEQSITDKRFWQQVDWELQGLEHSDMVLMYFDTNTKSPITLLELGLCKRKKIIVVCPQGFWRKGNIEVVCSYYGIPLKENLEDGIKDIRYYLKHG